MKKQFLILCVTLLLLTSNLSATEHDEICSLNANDQMEASTPTAQFDLTLTDVVTDKKTGLMWTRCPWGMEWDGGECVGDIAVAKKDWVAALTDVKDLETDNAVYLGHTGWRLPNVKELASIIERKCKNMAINDLVFSDSAAGEYWTNTHVVGIGSIRTINFISGSVTSAGRTETRYFRLVRDVTTE